MRTSTLILALAVLTTSCGTEAESKWRTAEEVPECGGQAGVCGCSDQIAEVCVAGEWSCPVVVNCDDPEQICDSSPPSCEATCGEAWAVCADNQWECEFDTTGCEPSDMCEVTSTSTLDGASIIFDSQRCEWTLAEVAAGIQIPYSIQLERSVLVAPEPRVSCASLGSAGLAQFESVFGEEDTYCLCDEGLCPNELGEVELVPGHYEFSIAWDGRNWMGPSDTGNPKGEPFPPGEYTALVSATGVIPESGEMYSVEATLRIRLVE